MPDDLFRQLPTWFDISLSFEGIRPFAEENHGKQLDSGYDQPWEAPAELSLFRAMIYKISSPVSIHLRWRTSSASPSSVIGYRYSNAKRFTEYCLPFTDNRLPKKGPCAIDP